MPRLPDRIGSFLACVGPVALVLLLIWLPFGLRLGALIEEWTVLGVFATEGPVFVVGPDSLLAEHRVRPLTVLPHAIAYLLDPDGFDAWHALLIAALAVKGACCAGLLFWVTGSRLSAAFFGMLVLVYPADTMQLSFRSLHISVSMALLLAGSLAQLQVSRCRRWWQASLLAGSSGTALILAAGMYEAALILAPLPVLAACMRFGWRHGVRRWWSDRIGATGWLLALGICIAHVATAFRGAGTYQANVLGSSVDLVAVLPQRLSMLMEIALPRALWGGWLDAGRFLRDAFTSHIYIGLAALALAAALVACRDRCAARESFEAAAPVAALPLGRIAACGFMSMILGYLPFLASMPHVHTTQRTYLWATPGAALVLYALVFACLRSHPRVRLAIGTGLLVLGLAAQLFQFDRFVQIHETQRSLLSRLAHALPRDGVRDPILVRDASASLADLWMLRLNLGAALGYVLGRPPVDVEICIEPGGYWQALDDLMRPGACLERPDRWMLRPAPPVGGPGREPARAAPDRTLVKERLHVLSIDASGAVTASAPATVSGAGPSTGATARRRLLDGVPPRFALDPFRPRGPPDRYEWPVGRYWGIEFPQRGVGWRSADWSLGPFRQTASVWKTQRYATLLFELTPSGTDYVLSGRFPVILSSDIAHEARMRLNGIDLAYRWMQGGAFEAPVPATVLRRGTNTLEFDAPMDPNYYGLSMALESVRLRPAE